MTTYTAGQLAAIRREQLIGDALAARPIRIGRLRRLIGAVHRWYAAGQL